MHLGILVFQPARWVEGPSSWGRSGAVLSIVSAAVLLERRSWLLLNCVQIDHQMVWELANILSSIPLLVKFAKVDSVDCK